MRFGENYIWSIHFSQPIEQSRILRALTRLQGLLIRIPGVVEVGYSRQEFP